MDMAWYVRMIDTKHTFLPGRHYKSKVVFFSLSSLVKENYTGANYLLQYDWLIKRRDGFMKLHLL